MKRLGIDIETYSSRDIKNVGVYAYADAPDFEVLLFAYKADDDPVKIIDLAQGEELPAEILQALFDPHVLKTAYNANFEMTCLTRWLGREMDPAQWSCTSVLALTLGLPGYLAGVAGALHFPEDKQKMKVGKRLIDYFCKPCRSTKANGMRTRNLPPKRQDAEHAELFTDYCKDGDDWELFKEYCRQDVVVEQEIRDRLERYLPSPKEHRLWELDQRINNGGILVDMTLVDNAIRLDYEIRSAALNDMRRLTGLDNPNSRDQLKPWLEARLDTKIDSLDKQFVEDTLKRTNLPADIREVLKLKQLVSKTSVKKYEAMKEARCSDGRIHGLLQFYGASRTGRWCLTGDHEVLTPDGWIRLDEWTGGMIACWAENENISFQKAEALKFDYEGPMYEYDDSRIKQISTPDHKMYVRRNNRGPWIADTVQNMAEYRPVIPFTGRRLVSPGLEHMQLRVLIMIQADGHYCEDGSIKLAFKKQRKIERCKQLLRRADITFQQRSYDTDGRTVFSIPSRNVPLWLRLFREKTFGWWLLDENPDVIFDELPNWDGYHSATNSVQYSSTNRQNADVIQALAHLSGRAASMRIKKRTHNPNWSDAYIVDIWLTPLNSHVIRSKPTVTEYKGSVYCASTPTGYFLVRREGKVWVTGNSGRLVQVHNLPQNHLEDLDTARQVVRDGDLDTLRMLYDNPSDVLSQLIRTALVARPGYEFLVADFSAIEARVIAWLAGEKWRLETFANGGDIYCASASAMFGVPVEKHGQNSHLRQKGKIAELALGYQGSVGALVSMGASRMGIPEKELAEIVTKWRSASPKIVKMWWDAESAAKQAIREKKPVPFKRGIVFSVESGILFIRLPGGRRIAYPSPKLVEDEKGKASITYMGTDQTSKGWCRLETYGGKLVENIVQATARDCLADAMLRLDEAGYKIRMHVHDEVIIEAPAGKEKLEDITAIMATNSSWNRGLPLAAAGYVTPYYKKD